MSDTTTHELKPKYYGGFFLLQNFTEDTIETGKIMHQFLLGRDETPLKHEYNISEIKHGESTPCFPFITASSAVNRSAADYWGFYVNLGHTVVGSTTCGKHYPLNLDPSAIGAIVVLQIVKTKGSTECSPYTFNISMETSPQPNYPTNTAEFEIYHS